MPAKTGKKTDLVATKNTRDRKDSSDERSETSRILSVGIRGDVDFVRLLLAVATDVVDGRISTSQGRCVVAAAGGIIKVAELNLRHSQQVLSPLEPQSGSLCLRTR